MISFYLVTLILSSFEDSPYAGSIHSALTSHHLITLIFNRVWPLNPIPMLAYSHLCTLVWSPAALYLPSSLHIFSLGPT